MQRTVLSLIAALAVAGAAWAAPGDQGQGRFLDVIVTLDVDARSQGPANSRAMAAETARQYGLQARHTYGTVYSGFSARIPEALLDQLRNDPLVATVSMDGPVHTMMGPPGGGGGGSDEQVVPWGIDRVGSQQNSNTGAGIEIYIIDTGIDPTHRDLNVVGGFAVEDCKGGGCATDWDDDNDHGTHVAGSAAALDNDVDVVGVAPDADLYAVKVLNRRGSGSFSGIIAGVDWVTQQAIDKGISVVANMSLGGGGSKSGTCTSDGFIGSDAFHEAICNSRNAGVVHVVAAGNSGADAQGAVPAAYDDAVITVSATNINDDWPSWSNWGNNAADWTSNDSAPVGIAAPGVSILSTVPGGTATFSGTSMASPHVAGAAALFLASSPQNNDESAFFNARAALLNQAESTNSFSNTSGNPHDEDFLDARGL